MTLHPGLSAVAGLIGTWRGEGAGEYPTIDSFTYTEEVTFTDVGKPFLHYVQRTWSPAGAPMHTETGYLRLVDGSAVEFVRGTASQRRQSWPKAPRATADGILPCTRITRRQLGERQTGGRHRTAYRTRGRCPDHPFRDGGGRRADDAPPEIGAAQGLRLPAATATGPWKLHAMSQVLQLPRETGTLAHGAWMFTPAARSAGSPPPGRWSCTRPAPRRRPP